MAVVSVVVGCNSDPGDGDALPERQLALDAVVGADGRSDVIELEIPEHTRSLTIVVQGDATALLALAELTLSDGADLVALPAGAPGDAMKQRYEQEQIGLMPGALYQSIRLGTFSHLYPHRPDQKLVHGRARLRVASDRPGPVRVIAMMPEDDAAAILPINVIVVSDVLGDPVTAEMTSELQRIYAQVGITVATQRVEQITGSTLSQISQSTEPQESPASQSARLPSLVGDRDWTGLDVFIVDSLPAGIAGLALGTPGPPLRGSYYFGIAIRGGRPALELARVIAHEAGHFLGLQHVENRGVSGMIYPDPLDDTRPGELNLMEAGTVLTPDQGFALSRSALLSR
ncbi:MAG: hypothetical protein AB7L28_03955 [Kofleriaceae bacterium]